MTVTKEAMKFSSDCLYASQELRRIVAGLSGPKAAARDKLEEAVERLMVLGESWFEDTVVSGLLATTLTL